MELARKTHARAARWLLAGMLACGAAAAVAQESPTLRKIEATGVITLGYRDNSPPFSYLDDRQRPIGYTMDLCRRIVGAVKRRLKLPDLQVKLTPVYSATRIPMVANHTVDLECGTTTNNVERQKQVAFTVTTFVAASRLVSKRESQIRVLGDLRGKTVVSTAGATSLALLVDLNATRGLEMNILTGKDNVQSFYMVQSDRAAAFAMDDVLLYGLLATVNDPASFVVTAEPLSVEPYGIGLRKGDAEFKKLADDTLIALFTTGEIHVIYRKWFESTIPPQQINLRRPMSTALANAIARPTDSGDPADYR